VLGSGEPIGPSKDGLRNLLVSAVPLLLVPALERMVRSWSREITPGNLATAAFGPTDIAPSLVTKRVGPPYAAVLATARPTKSA